MPGVDEAVSFEDFYARERVSTVRLAARLSSAAQAEDVAAEAFLRLYDRWATVSDPGAYLARTIRHIVIDNARRRATAERYAASKVVEEPPRRLLDDDLTTRDELTAALARPAPQQRVSVVLRYWCDPPGRRGGRSRWHLRRHGEEQFGAAAGSVAPLVRVLRHAMTRTHAASLRRWSECDGE